MIAFLASLVFVLFALGAKQIFKVNKVKKCAILKAHKFFNICKVKYKALNFNPYLKHVNACINFNRVNSFNLAVDYSKLQSCGLFAHKPIFKENINELNKLNKLKLKTLKKFEQEVAITICASNEKVKQVLESFVKQHNLKCNIINLETICYSLLFEINKLNINYKPKENSEILEGFFVEKEKLFCPKWNGKFYSGINLVENEKVEYYKFLLPKKEENILNYTNFHKAEILKFNAIKINKAIKLKNEFFKVEKTKNNLTINYLSGEVEKYFFNFNFSFFIKKYNKNVFLVLNFKFDKFCTQKNELVCICCTCKNCGLTLKSLSAIKLENEILWKSFFNIKFCFKNENLNKVLNEKLPEVFIKQNLDGVREKQIDISGMFEIEKQKHLSYKSVIKNFFGISFKENLLVIRPNKNASSFAFNLTVKEDVYNVSFERGGLTQVENAGKQFVNLSGFNLKNLLDKNIKFCG